MFSYFLYTFLIVFSFCIQFVDLFVLPIENKLLLSALRNMNSDIQMGWTVAFSLKSYCNIKDGFLFELEKEETVRYVGCSKPFSPITWYCMETNLNCISLSA